MTPTIDDASICFANVQAHVVVDRSGVGEYGGTTSLKATLTLTTDGSGLVGKPIALTLNGNAVGTAVTNGGCRDADRRSLRVSTRGPTPPA